MYEDLKERLEDSVYTLTPGRFIESLHPHQTHRRLWMDFVSNRYRFTAQLKMLFGLTAVELAREALIEDDAARRDLVQLDRRIAEVYECIDGLKLHGSRISYYGNIRLEYPLTDIGYRAAVDVLRINNAGRKEADLCLELAVNSCARVLRHYHGREMDDWKRCIERRCICRVPVANALSAEFSLDQYLPRGMHGQSVV